MLVRQLECGEAPSKSDQVAIGSHGAGVRDTEDAAKSPNRVVEKFLGKYQSVSRGIGAIRDPARVIVGQPEVYIVAQRVLGEGHQFTLLVRRNYSSLLCDDDGATLDDLREAVTTLEETSRTARRVLGGTHPSTMVIGAALRVARAALRARETPGDA